MKYEYVDEKLSNGNILHYKVTESGTAYDKNTPDDLVATIERLRNNRTRVRLYFGDSSTGRDWEEQYSVFGRIGRSTGSIKIPLLISSSRSTGGEGLLDSHIIKIEYANKKDGGVIWQHPSYHRSEDSRDLANRSYYKKSTRPRKTRKKSAHSAVVASLRGMR